MTASEATTPVYPAATHQSHSHSRQANPEALVLEQPGRTGAMSPTASLDERNRTQEPMRLRGGCVPCPGGGMCWIIPIPCCF
ncbi:hypothetical protein D9615_002092 [Tricholomella constricta]|uniref:Uncharacterized protein n=1 Tax=Tricholomella constricta TaxID=117010 RepID=A0A8H5MB44_9AGAR|nr:hypothetical protein D9615_002092 [Tricholomella constricta]